MEETMMLRRSVPGLFQGLFLAVAVLFSAPAAAQQNPDFWLVNTSGRTIAEAFVSSSAVNSWGTDRLGQNVLANGMRIAMRPPRDGTCIFDVRVVYGDGTAEERRRINTCVIAEVVFGSAARGPQAAPGQGTPSQPPSGPPSSGPPSSGRAQSGIPTGPNPNFRLVNRSGRVITELYVSSVQQQNWGPDRLGRDVLGAGQSMMVTLPRDGTCVYDIRVVYADNTATERRRVNTCTIAEVTFP
jgi:hypothetical protein